MAHDPVGDLKFLKNPMRWPHMLVPLKRPKGHDPLGDLAIYQPGAIAEGVNLIKISLASKEVQAAVKWTPITPEEVIAAGWEVD